MAKKNVPQQVDQAAINMERGYKVVLVRMEVPECALPAAPAFCYIETEGKTGAEVEAEKEALKAQGTNALSGQWGKDFYARWCGLRARNDGDHGLTDAALGMLRTQYAVNC